MYMNIRTQLTRHAGDRNTCTHQEIPSPCQLEQLNEYPLYELIFAQRYISVIKIFESQRKTFLLGFFLVKSSSNF